MTKKVIATSVVMGAMFTLIGCGGGSGGDTNTGGNNDPKPATVTGVFQDANVAGLNYACSSGKTDVTTNEGEYTCNVGDIVEFSLGGYVLGNVNATSGIVTPMSLYPDNLEAATNVLQLLQTLDSGEDGTITIPDNFSALDDVTTTPSDSTFDDVMEEELGEALVSEDDAQAHMLKTLLAGKTLYTTIWDDIGTLESWSFNEDLTSSTWTELVGGDATGTGTVSIDGMTMTFTCTSDSEQVCEPEPTIIEVKEILADYLVLEVRGGELGTEIETLRLYFEKAKAEVYLESLLNPDLEALIVGKTVYQKCGETVDSMTFQANGELVSVENGQNVTVGYRIEGNIVYTIEEDGEDAHIFAGATADYIKFQETNGGITTFYFTSEAAQAAPPSDCGGDDEGPFSFTTDWLNGKSLYFVQYDDFGYDVMKWNMARMDFTVNTFAWTEYDTADTGTHIFTYTVNSDGNIVYNYGDGNDHVISFNDMTNDSIKICQDGDCNTYLFFDEGKARDFRDSQN